MNKTELFKRLLPLVNGPHWDRLEDYLVYEREQLIETLCGCSDIKQINRLQGQILELNKILDLPEDLKRRTS